VVSRTWYRCISRARGDGSTRAPTDPRNGTNVAVAMPLAAMVAAGASAEVAGGGLGALGPAATLVLAVVVAVLGRFPLVLGPRTMYALDTPMVLLAGLLGGPLAGAVVGAGSGIGDVGGVWRRRSAYTGISALQGIVAGHAGIAWSDGRLGLVSAAIVGAAGMLVIGAAGLALVQLDRRSFLLSRLVWSASTDVAGLGLGLSGVMLMAVAYGSRPLLVVATAGSLAGAAVVFSRLGEQREAAAAERHEAVLRDWLTGAASRATFELELERTRESVLRGAHPAGLLILDADHFKTVNDTFGHQTGDAVLCELVRRLQVVARAIDVVARWGGEEFCVLVPGIATVEDLAAFAERVRAAVADAPFTPDGIDEPIAMTISIGGTLLDGALPASEVFEHADRALYRAKLDRNVACILPLPASGGPAAGARQTAGARA